MVVVRIVLVMVVNAIWRYYSCNLYTIQFYISIATIYLLGVSHKSGPLSQPRELGDWPRLMADPEYMDRLCKKKDPGLPPHQSAIPGSYSLLIIFKDLTGLA